MPNLNNPISFTRFAVSLGNLLSSGVKPIEARHLASALSLVRQGDWHGMTPKQVEKLLAGMAEDIAAIGPIAAPRVVGLLEGPADVMLASVRRNLSRTLAADVAAALPATQAATYEFLRTSQSLWVSDQYGVRSLAATDKARTIVEAGLKEGLTNAQISKQLAPAMSDIVVGRSASYYDTVSTVFANRSRTYANLATFDELGVRRYRFQATLDERTSNQCRFMHGQVGRVDQGLRRMGVPDRAKNTQAATKLVTPWMRQRIVREGGETFSIGAGKTTQMKEGDKVMYVDRPGGKRLLVARIDEEGTGEGTGRYARKMPPGQLQSVGLVMPPLHGRCRSQVVAI